MRFFATPLKSISLSLNPSLIVPALVTLNLKPVAVLSETFAVPPEAPQPAYDTFAFAPARFARFVTKPKSCGEPL